MFNVQPESPEQVSQIPSRYEWLRASGSEAPPFVVVSEAGGGQMPTGQPHYRDIAIRWMTTDEPGQTHFVAMRRTPDGVEQIDSRRCDFQESVFALRNLAPPVLFIPGVDPKNPISQPPYPAPFHGSLYTVLNFTARQPDAQPIRVELSATSGHLASAVRDVFEATDSCWPSAQPTDEGTE